jgi:acyl carrier protein
MFEGQNTTGNNIIQSIRRFLTDRAWLRDEDRVLESDSLLEKGVIDSMAMVELISFIEETYNIRIQDEELMPENFDSLAAIAAFIVSKRNGR